MIIFTSLENTFPLTKIFASPFNGSMAFFSKKIVSINLRGAREWNDYWPIIFSIRIPEILDEYRKNGLDLYRYYLFKNYSLRGYFPHLIYVKFNQSQFLVYHLLLINIYFTIILYLIYPITVVIK